MAEIKALRLQRERMQYIKSTVESWYNRKKGESHTLLKKRHLIRKIHFGGDREHFSVFCKEKDCIQVSHNGNLRHLVWKL